MSQDIHLRSAISLGKAIQSREISCVEVATAFLDRIDSLDSQFGAFLAHDRESVLSAAAESQKIVDSGEAGPLTGVPVAVKDNISTNGLETTCASKILKGYVPPFDATVVEALKASGCVVLGKTNMDEFAMGASTETSAYKICRNPWDTERSPGGSSGGSACAVASRLAPISLGSDTGGSIRQPAALCGVVGFKPTYGRCSRYGLIAFGSSLDQIGPIGQCVEDVAYLAQATTGHDPLDSTSLNLPPISTAELKSRTIKGMKVALPEELFGDGVDSGVREAVNVAVEKLLKAGAEVTTISLPSIKLGVTTYYIIAPAEASSNLARFDGIRFGHRASSGTHIGVVERSLPEGFGHEVKQRIMIGTYALSAGYYDAYYLKAQQVRAMMRQEFDKVLSEYDLVLGPTSPIPAFRLGEMADDPLALKLVDFCTIPANMGGMPAISIPCGHTQNGLPVGLQLLGGRENDEFLLSAAYAIEQELGFGILTPPTV